MKTLTTIFTLIIITLSTTSAAGIGGGGKSYEDGLFWSADLNRNERIDRDEAKAVYNLAEDHIFARYDENGNGSINRPEFMEFIQQSPWINKFVHPRDQ